MTKASGDSAGRAPGRKPRRDRPEEAREGPDKSPVDPPAPVDCGAAHDRAS